MEHSITSFRLLSEHLYQYDKIKTDIYNQLKRFRLLSEHLYQYGIYVALNKADDEFPSPLGASISIHGKKSKP